MDVFIGLVILAVLILPACMRIVNQNERGVVMTLGRFSGIKEPGLNFLIPGIQTMYKVDIRTKTADVPNQEVITKDNIPVQINAVVYYRIQDAAKAILEVENFMSAVSQLAQTTMRNAVGERTLDELLSKREEIAENIKEILDVKTDPWGIDVEILELKDVAIPDDLKRTISKVAEAEREKKAVIINSEGDKIAAANLADAARTLQSSPGAMHLRTLQSINDLSSDQSNTIIWMIPTEVLEAFKGFGDKMKK
ncbi:MAG: SPFH domain-containing protein [Candidatus Saccharibacteria bacterium]|nr:SPFH domain-containing protein [Candidatus Saccharibacteria bacterium]